VNHHAILVAASLCAIGFAAAQPPPIGSRAPSVELGEFGAAHLDRILSPLDQRIDLPRGLLTELRESFIDRGSKAMTNEKPAYQQAVAVCNAVSQAMDERDQAISNVQGSSTVHGSYDLGAHRKDRPNWKELQRERHEEQNRKEQAAQKDNFLNTQLRTNWQQRAIQLRRTIDQLYARERELERQAQQGSNVGGPLALTDSITLDKPIQVKVKYGTATIPAGTTLPVVNRDANGVVVDYAGEKVTLPK
jgi:hypothetical protein